MGGAIVFPGGKLDPKDRDPVWTTLTTAAREAPFAPDHETARALAIAACRETLEEATMLLVVGATTDSKGGSGPVLPARAPPPHEELVALRKRLAAGEQTLASWLAAARHRLDLASLLPLSRWITPTAETRRYDTRFFLAVAGPAHRGAHDDHETTASFWATPEDLLARFAAGAVQLLPPTHRTLSLLTGLARAADAEAFALASCKDPICPELVRHKDAPGAPDPAETMALVLPGDPEHPVKTPRVPGPSRFVLRGTRWLPEGPP
jgi:8-oxo-dGTP pyrophosphatase MutT (NUDIX family)